MLQFVTINSNNRISDTYALLLDLPVTWVLQRKPLILVVLMPFCNIFSGVTFVVTESMYCNSIVTPAKMLQNSLNPNDDAGFNCNRGVTNINDVTVLHIALVF